MFAKSTLLTVLCFSTCAATAAPGQQEFDNYFQALGVFWGEIYSDGGHTLYCNQAFGNRKGRSINVEHVYPMAWAMRSEGCDNRDQCRRVSARFNRIEADLHNLYPARKDINKIRGSFPFASVRGEAREFGDCDFELDRRRRQVEPRAAARGNIARAMFYMHHTYGLKIFRKQGELLQRWHRQDPPDDEERRRNRRIAALQGNRNPFIDAPETADRLSF